MNAIGYDDRIHAIKRTQYATIMFKCGKSTWRDAGKITDYQVTCPECLKKMRFKHD